MLQLTPASSELAYQTQDLVVRRADKGRHRKTHGQAEMAISNTLAVSIIRDIVTRHWDGKALPKGDLNDHIAWHKSVIGPSFKHPKFQSNIWRRGLASHRAFIGASSPRIPNISRT